jgi:putative aldouronate transport system substrate-binding protein
MKMNYLNHTKEIDSMKKGMFHIGIVLAMIFLAVSCAREKPALSAAGTKEPYEVIITYLTFGQTPRDLALVEEEINKISIPAVNAKVALYPMSLFEAATQTSLMISSGEKLDLLMCLFQGGPGTLVNNGQIIALDELYEKYGAGIKATEGIAMAGGYFNGSLYAIPSEEKMGRQSGVMIRSDLLGKYPWNKNEWDMITHGDLDRLFSRVRAGEGSNLYMLNIVGPSLTTFNYFHNVDSLGATLAAGGLMNGGLGDTKIVNVFATPEYKENLDWFRKWYQAGYFNRDCVTMTETGLDLMKTGRYFAALNPTEADMKAKYIQDTGALVTAFNGSSPYAMTSIYQLSQWCIPVTCEDPETTFKFLNLMYESVEINNLLHNGIEGIHYVKAGDWERGNWGIINMPEGITMDSSGYYNPLGLWGDKSKRYNWPPITADYYEELRDFNAGIDSRVASKALGYCFDSFPVRTEYAAVNDVITQYRASLESGSVDPATALPQFLRALDAAGIGSIITENQRQLDAWLASGK